MNLFHLRSGRGILFCTTGMVIVGGSIPISAQLAGYPFFTGQALRYALATMILIGVMAARGQRWIRPTPTQCAQLAGIAALGLVAFNLCIVIGTQYADPSLIGAVIGASPVAMALIAPLVRSGGRATSGLRLFEPRLVLAALIVSGGVVIVSGGGRVSAVGLLCALGALIGEVSFSLLAVPVLAALGALRVSTYACAAAVPMLMLCSVLFGESWQAPTGRELFALLYLALLVTALAFVLWYTGLTHLGAGRAGLLAGIIPLAALTVSVLSGTEPLTLTAVVGCGAVAAGLTLGLLGNAGPPQDSGDSSNTANPSRLGSSSAPAASKDTGSAATTAVTGIGP